MENKKEKSLTVGGRETVEEWLNLYSHSKAVQTLKRVNSLPDVFRAKTPSLARTAKDFGEEFTIRYLAEWIAEMNDLSGAGNTMTEKQCLHAAQLIMNENPMLTVADIKLVFDNAVSGRYGSLYNSVDIPKVCSWFRKHWQERLEEAEHQSYINHIGTKGPDMDRSRGVVDMKEAIHRHNLETMKAKHSKP